jgi:glycosyltransferase involved in cell wall biosynthesis
MAAPITHNPDLADIDLKAIEGRRKQSESALAPVAADPAGIRGRILFAIHTPADQLSAVYKIALHHAQHLQANGYSCKVVTPANFAVTRKVSARFIPLLYPLELAAWLCVHAPEFDIVVFHSYAGWFALSLSRLIARLARLRTAVQFHGLEPLYLAQQHEEAKRSNTPLSWRYRLLNGRLMPLALRHACRHANHVFCLNTEELRFLLDSQWVRSGHIDVVANPVPTTFFFPRVYRERARQLLFVGQWLPIKGTRYLTEAFHLLRRKHTDLRLVCAGTLANEEAVLSDFAPEVREHVEVIPRLSPSRMTQVFETCDLFVFPTLLEGSSVALLEAAASGMPIVTTPVGAAPDFLQHDFSAIFCPTRNADALHLQVETLLDQPGIREHLGRNAQASANRFRAERVLSEYETLLSELLNEAWPNR